MPPDISAVHVQRGKLKIQAIVCIINLKGAGKKKSIASFVCDLPSKKEPLFNVQVLITLVVLPANYPNHIYTTGRDYDHHNIEVILGDNDRFMQRLYSPEE